jgi:hypothetical protein
LNIFNLIGPDRHEKAIPSNEYSEEEVYLNPSEKRIMSTLNLIYSQKGEELDTLIDICIFMRSTDKNKYEKYSLDLLPFLQNVLTSKKESPNSLFTLLKERLPELNPELFNEIYNWIVYYVSKYLFNSYLVSLVNIQLEKNKEASLTLLNENESSDNDFKHILLISGFMVFSRKSKYDLYSKDINIGDNSITEFDVEFLNRILEYRIYDENELYFILKFHLPKDINFDLMYNGFMYHLLEYFNILNIMSSFSPPPLLALEPPSKLLSFLESQEDEALQENLIEKKYRLDLHYQIQHYWAFVNDLIINKLYSYCIKFREDSDPIGPIDSEPIDSKDNGDMPVDSDDNDPRGQGPPDDNEIAIKTVAIGFIKKATREEKYQFLYHLLSIYINTYGLQKDDPKDILIEINFESKNGIPVNYKLFYESYTIFSMSMPEIIDNLQNWMRVFVIGDYNKFLQRELDKNKQGGKRFTRKNKK